MLDTKKVQNIEKILRNKVLLNPLHGKQVKTETNQLQTSRSTENIIKPKDYSNRTKLRRVYKMANHQKRQTDETSKYPISRLEKHIDV